MRTSLDSMFSRIREFFAKMARKDKIRLAVLIVIIIILAIVAVSLLGRTKYVLMYTASSPAEAGRISDALLEMGESARTEGTKILVPEGDVDRLRNKLAADGALDANDLINYDILGMASGFNITTEQAEKYYDAQKSLEIKTQIQRIDKIQSAIVTVTSGKYSPFVVSTGVRDATAAVMLVVRGGATLTPQEAQEIAELVKSNVPGLKYENLKITDSKLNRYNVGEESVDIGTELDTRLALRNMLIQQTKSAGEQLLMPIFGPDNVQITADVRLNFDEKTVESVEYFQIIPGELDSLTRSSSEVYEAQRSATAAEGIPGTDSNAMGTVEYPYGTLEDGDLYKRAVIEKNNEINETRTRIKYEQGSIERVTIAVAINSERIYSDYTDQVVHIVAKGLGIAEGDVAVEYLPFIYEGIDFEQLQAEWDEIQAQERKKEMLQTIIMWAVILLLGLALISFLKSIVRAVKGPAELEEYEPAEGEEGYEGDYIDYIIDDDISELAMEQEEVALQTKSTSLEQIEKFIDRDPAAVAQLLRNWLTDD